MIKEFLKLMSLENLTLAEITQKLKISRDELKNRLEMMKRMGYIEALSEDKPNSESACASCRMTKFCSPCSEGNAGNLRITVYRLTDKGRRVLNSS